MTTGAFESLRSAIIDWDFSRPRGAVRLATQYVPTETSPSVTHGNKASTRAAERFSKTRHMENNVEEGPSSSAS